MAHGFRQRDRIQTAISVLFRTPGLFIIDYWWQNERKRHSEDEHYVFSPFYHMPRNLVFLAGLLLLVLPIKYIRFFYSHIAFLSILIISHLLSYYYIQDATPFDKIQAQLELYEVANQPEKIENQVCLLAVHVALAIIISLLIERPQKLLTSAFACCCIPPLARTLGLSLKLSINIHHLSSLLVATCVLRYLYRHIPAPSVVKQVAVQWIFFVADISFGRMLSELSRRVFVPLHFLLFWVLVFTSKLYTNTLEKKQAKWHAILLLSVSDLCTSPISLISTAVAVTYLSYFSLKAVKYFLSDKEEGVVPPFNRTHHSGWTEGATVLLLSLLTGLADLQAQVRMAVLTIILFVVLSSLLQSMLEIAEPSILSLSTISSRKFHHAKILLLCSFLFFFPLHVTWVLASIFPIDFWMLVVFSTSLLTSVQVLDLVIVHCFLWYDSNRKEPWAPLDEVVYYVRGLTKVIEFLVATCVVWVGLYEEMTNKWNWTNFFILIVHCYYNVLQRLQIGYRSFRQRQAAVRKASNLPRASQDQLFAHNDVCAICYAQMMNESESVVIPCRHIFHRVCFKRWLCFQERCPLCSASVRDECTEKLFATQ